MSSMWDLAGQPQYAAGLQPYIVPARSTSSSVPALDVATLDANYADLVGRWLDYLQAGAPDAVVQPVLTHCDALMPPTRRTAPPRPSRTADAAGRVGARTRSSATSRRMPAEGSAPLKVQEKVHVRLVRSRAATSRSRRCAKRLEEIVFAEPPLLPSVGQLIPRTWLLAMTTSARCATGATRSPAAAVGKVAGAAAARGGRFRREGRGRARKLGRGRRGRATPPRRRHVARRHDDGGGEGAVGPRRSRSAGRTTRSSTTRCSCSSTRARSSRRPASSTCSPTT